jgi:SAM-dependent methyltransferase
VEARAANIRADQPEGAPTRRAAEADPHDEMIGNVDQILSALSERIRDASGSGKALRPKTLEVIDAVLARVHERAEALKRLGTPGLLEVATGPSAERQRETAAQQAETEADLKAVADALGQDFEALFEIVNAFSSDDRLLKLVMDLRSSFMTFAGRVPQDLAMDLASLSAETVESRRIADTTRTQLTELAALVKALQEQRFDARLKFLSEAVRRLERRLDGFFSGDDADEVAPIEPVENEPAVDETAAAGTATIPAVPGAQTADRTAKAAATAPLAAKVHQQAVVTPAAPVAPARDDRTDELTQAVLRLTNRIAEIEYRDRLAASADRRGRPAQEVLSSRSLFVESELRRRLEIDLSGLTEFRKAYQQPLAKAIDAPGSKDVVILGCPAAETLDQFLAARFSLTLVEANPFVAEQVRHRVHTLGDVRPLEFVRRAAEGSLAAIFASGHTDFRDLEDVTGFFADAFRAVKPGGVVVCEMPNPEDPATAALWMSRQVGTRLFHQDVLRLSADHAGFRGTAVELPAVSIERQSKFDQSKFGRAVKSLVAAPGVFTFIAWRPEV